MPEAIAAVPLIGDALGGLGGALGSLFGAGAAAAPAAAAASAPLDLLSFGGADAAAAAGAGAAGAALPAGVIGGLGGDLASAGTIAGLGDLTGAGAGAGGSAILAANAPSPLDTAAYPSGPIGAPAGTTAAPTATGAGAGAVSPPAGVNAPTDLTAVNPAVTPPVTPPGAPPPTVPPQSGSLFDKLLGGIGSTISKNPLGTALAAGGLAYNVMEGQKNSAAVNALEAQAAQAASQGTTLQSYLQNGTLPPALQAQLTQATAAAKARILANYANTPGGADPTKNSALAQELNNLNIQAIASAAQIEQQLLSSGITESQLASTTLTTLANIDQAQSARVGQSIANFATALGGGGTGVTLKVTP